MVLDSEGARNALVLCSFFSMSVIQSYIPERVLQSVKNGQISENKFHLVGTLVKLIFDIFQ